MFVLNEQEWSTFIVIIIHCQNQKSNMYTFYDLNSDYILGTYRYHDKVVVYSLKLVQSSYKCEGNIYPIEKVQWK